MNLDLTVIPLHRRDGQDQSYLPGLLAASSPRRAARGRGDDRLIIQLSVPHELSLSADAQASLLQDMADGYFRSAGAVTTALREQIERLNSYFLQRNQRAAQGGTPTPALLSMLSIHQGRATLAQCGPVQAFLLKNEIEHLYDPQTAGRGLGLSQNPAIRFHQFELQSGQMVLTLADLPSGWSEKTLSDATQTRLPNLRRRLLSEAGPQLAAALVSAQTGKGELHLAAGPEMEPKAQPVKDMAAPTKSTTAPQTGAWESVEVPAEEIPEGGAGELVSFEAEASENKDMLARGRREVNQVAEILAKARDLTQSIFPPIRNFLGKVLPEEPVFNLPPQVMGLIAILVPIAVVILVAFVYLQFGRGQLYINYLERAQSAAAIATASQDPAEQRQAWQGVVYYAERAAHYEQDQQTANTLLAQAQAALDGLDGIRRMEFSPALFQPLSADARITRIVATNNEMYMLNSTDGSILRAYLAGDGAGGGYQVDDGFRCGPGRYGDFIVTKLIDLALLPRENAAGADILAMDANGNVLYCAEGKPPSAQTLVPPDSNWGQPQAIRVANGNLYVLDPLTNAVWIYFGEGYSFQGEPRFFFGAQVPSLKNVLDLAVDGDDLYLLSEDGHIAKCTFGQDVDNPTTCHDPAEYTDTRPGYPSGPQILGTNFEQMKISDPPQPALFILDPVARAVYRFSLTLSLDTQFQSLSVLPEGLATGFAVTPNRAILLALDNDVYIGFLPSEP